MRAAICYNMRECLKPAGMDLGMADDQTRKCGTWTLGREIGRGAYGIVYLARAQTAERRP